MPIVPINEQETVIQFSRDEKEAHIWTSDSTVINKLDHRVEASEDWECVSEERIGAGVFAKNYVCPKRLISFRSKTQTANMTDEQKKALAERIRKAREAQH